MINRNVSTLNPDMFEQITDSLDGKNQTLNSQQNALSNARVD